MRDDLKRIKEAAELVTTPSLLTVDKETGVYALRGSDGETLAAFEIEDVASFNFHTSAREHVLALCREIEALELERDQLRAQMSEAVN